VTHAGAIILGLHRINGAAGVARPSSIGASVTLWRMSMEPQEPAEAPEPIGHVRIVYLGPVAPHWEVQSDYGDSDLIDTFRDRVLARLVLLPPHDPQFRRNRERVIRDAERENLAIEWDLGFPEEGEAAE
jgi:hypothetical protein